MIKTTQAFTSYDTESITPAVQMAEKFLDVVLEEYRNNYFPVESHSVQIKFSHGSKEPICAHLIEGVRKLEGEDIWCINIPHSACKDMKKVWWWVVEGAIHVVSKEKYGKSRTVVSKGGRHNEEFKKVANAIGCTCNELNADGTKDRKGWMLEAIPVALWQKVVDKYDPDVSSFNNFYEPKEVTTKARSGGTRINWLCTVGCTCYRISLSSGLDGSKQWCGDCEKFRTAEVK